MIYCKIKAPISVSQRRVKEVCFKFELKLLLSKWLEVDDFNRYAQSFHNVTFVLLFSCKFSEILNK